MIARIVSRPLYLANAHPPMLDRKRFYALKDRLCRRYGVAGGIDIQHIVDLCWGYARDGRCLRAACTKCGGTGVYLELWYELERWCLGDRTFHRPTGRRWAVPPKLSPERPIIEGRIEHRAVHPRVAGEAQLWLSLVFDPGLFWRLLSLHRFALPGWYPMLRLQAATFSARLWLARWCPRRCASCTRRFIRPFEPGRWFVCRHCSPPIRRPAMRAMTPDDELPF